MGKLSKLVKPRNNLIKQIDINNMPKKNNVINFKSKENNVINFSQNENNIRELVNNVMPNLNNTNPLSSLVINDLNIDQLNMLKKKFSIQPKEENHCKLNLLERIRKDLLLDIYPEFDKSIEKISLDEKTYENLLKINEKVKEIVKISTGYDHKRFSSLIDKKRYDTYHKYKKNKTYEVTQAQMACRQGGDIKYVMNLRRAGNCAEQAFLFKALWDQEFKNQSSFGVGVYETMGEYLEGGDHALVIVYLKINIFSYKAVYVFDPFLGKHFSINEAFKAYNTLKCSTSEKFMFKYSSKYKRPEVEPNDISDNGEIVEELTITGK